MARKNDHKILITFGNNLKRHRKAKGYSLRQFAALADIDHAMVDRYERGVTNPSLTTVAKLAEALDIDVCDLISSKR
jgi:transcriptional regulator with XRE-family HTH domain